MMTRWLSQHTRSLVLAFLLLTAAGLGAALHLPVSLFPRIDFPRVVVSVDAGDKAADQTVAQVTRPLEQALRGVPGVQQIRSTTSRGSADISLNFPWGHDMVAATLQTQAALAAATPDLPPGVSFTVKRMDPTVFPVLGLALSSPSRDAVSLRRYADLTLRPLIAATPGAADVEVLGGGQAEYQVLADPARLQALGIGMDDLAKAIAAGNTVVATGKLEDRHQLYLTVVDSRLTGLLTLGHVADVQLVTAPAWTRITAQGADAVLINVRQTPEADSVALVKAVRARLNGLGAAAPADIKVATFYDQSELVTAAAGSVRDAILLGAVLAGVVLFLFLRNVRLMLVTALLLPATLAAACLILFVMGMSFNMMTLGGMAAAVGLVVDDTVVMLEHLVRRFREAPEGEGRAALLPAAGEMTRPLIGSSLSTIVIFVPLAFLGGVTGGFFRALAVTMAAALTISLQFALFIAPILARAWLRERDVAEAERADALMARSRERYGRWAGRALEQPLALVAVVGVGLIALGGLAYTQLPSGFMPKMDEGGFVLDYTAHPGAALSDTDRLLRQVEAIIRATPDVDSYSRRTGAQLGGGLTEADEGDFFIHLKRGHRRNVEVVMAEIRRKVQSTVPGLDIETAQLMEDLIGDLTAVPEPIEVKLFGDDDAQLVDSARKVAGALGGIDGVVEVVGGLRVAGDAIDIHVDPAAAAMIGLDPDAVAKKVEASVGGTVATQILSGEQVINVRVRLPQDLRGRASALGNLLVRGPDGRTAMLGSIVRISVVAGQREITREDLAPFIPVTARLEGKDLGTAMGQVKSAVAGLHLPAGIRVEYGGLYAQQTQSFADLTTVFIAALLLSALLLTLLFERWAYTIAVIATVLLSTTAVFVGLWLTGTELDISALMGLTMVIGMITELAIFFLAELPEGAAVTAAGLVAAGRARLRPILMSALIAILTLLPLALGISRGAGLQTPLATAIIAGLVIGAPLVLCFLPVLLLAMTPRRAAPEVF